MTYTFKIARRLASNHRRSMLLVSLLAAAGCTAGGNPVITDQPGAITLTINGLANGASPEVTLIGPGGSRKSVTHSGAVRGLPLGSYEIVAAPSTGEGTTFTPAELRQSVTLTGGAPTAAAAINYQVATGALQLRIEGLPASTASAVRVEGPGGFRLDVAGTALLRGLAPGSYSLFASPRSSGGATYYPTDPTLTVTVVASLTPASALVHFARLTGSLKVETTGLPDGVVGRFTLVGPGSYSASLTAGVELNALDPGQYIATAEPAQFDGHTWAPLQASVPVTIDTGHTVLSIPYDIITGALAIEVAGLPAGAEAAFTVSGPDGFTRSGTSGIEYKGLKPGRYTTTAASVSAGGRVFHPRKVSDNHDVTKGREPKRGRVEYSESTGSLALSLSGLPAGVNAQVIVIGPASVDTMAASGMLGGLAAGSYTLVASPVGSGSAAYAPSPVSQVVTVASNSSAAAAVSYAASSGSLRLDVGGLPSGAAAAITVSGPAGYTNTVTGTSTLTPLAPGSYTVSAAAVTIEGTTYTPAPASQVVAVNAGATAVAAVGHSATATPPTSGSLSLVVAGLPSGAAAAITVTGPEGFSQAVTSTATLNSLAPGTYTITAATVTVGGTSYAPTPTSQTASVSAGATTARTVSHSATTPSSGRMIVTVSGLPSGTAAAITVSHTSGFSQTATATDTVTGFPVPATLTVAAQSVTVGGVTYTPSPTSQTGYVTAGATVERTVTYAATAPSTGSLSLTVSGLPGGTAAAITVSGPGGFSQVVAGTSTLGSLAVGTYTIAATTVSAGGTSYVPTPASQSASITAGTTTSRTVSYAASSGGGGPATVTVDTMTQYQVMGGWEATAQIGQTDFASTPWAAAVASAAADDLGINQLRLEVKAGSENPTDWFALWRAGSISDTEWRNNRYATVNDNGSATSLNASGFHFTELDLAVVHVVLPLKQRLEANGERLRLNLNYVGFTAQAGHVHSNPSEYAELILATFLHLRDTYGLVPDAVEVILEPDNNTFWTGTLVGQAIVASGSRLAAAGFHPEFIGPSTMSMSQAITWFDQLVQVPGALNYLGGLSYHRYAGVSDANLATLRSRAQSSGLRTAMLEHIGSGVEDLYKDLTIANVSSWQQFALAYPTSDNGAQYYVISGSTPIMASRTKLLRQYFRYVREGARRVAATSASAGVRPVAFTNPGGGMAVVLHVDAAGSYTVAGIRPGNYGVELTTLSGSRIQLPNVTATSGATVTVAPTSTGVLTLYRVP